MSVIKDCHMVLTLLSLVFLSRFFLHIVSFCNGYDPCYVRVKAVAVAFVGCQMDSEQRHASVTNV